MAVFDDRVWYTTALAASTLRLCQEDAGCIGAVVHLFFPPSLTFTINNKNMVRIEAKISHRSTALSNRVYSGIASSIIFVIFPLKIGVCIASSPEMTTTFARPSVDRRL